MLTKTLRNLNKQSCASHTKQIRDYHISIVHAAMAKKRDDKLRTKLNTNSDSSRVCPVTCSKEQGNRET